MEDLVLDKKNRRALVLIAHPDDETIWMGGSLLHYARIDWTILSLCRKTDKDRYPKYLRACQFYRAQALISDLEDENILTIEKSIPEIKKRINQLLEVKKFDYLFSHAQEGEYGHARHIGVHRAVKELIQEKKLEAEQVFYFCYQAKTYLNQIKISNNFTKAKYILKLTPQEFKQKKKIIHQIYGFARNSFEYLSCLNLETFC
jgi:LmbE family N-acetylglucosaminyl deacetylase